MIIIVILFDRITINFVDILHKIIFMMESNYR